MKVESRAFRFCLPPTITGLPHFEHALFMAVGLVLYGAAVTV